jgi:hypothetical protein
VARLPIAEFTAEVAERWARLYATLRALEGVQFLNPFAPSFELAALG